MYEINIIIPCYYDYKTIYPCFQSLANQTNKNFIVTIVNDCSPNTNCKYQDIIKEFSQYYPINYYETQENSGPGVARQLGLDNNKSLFVMFVDDDDRLVTNAIEIYNKYLDPYVSYLSGKQQFQDYDYIDNINLTGSIFNAKVIKELNVSFDNIRYEEDSLFIEEFMIKYNRFQHINPKYRIININDIIYIHQCNKNSLCSACDMTQYFHDLMMKICKILLNQPNDFFTKDYVYNNLNNIIIYGINLYSNIEDTKPLYELLVKYQIVDLQLDYSTILPYYKDKIDTSLNIKKYKEEYENVNINN